MHIRKVRGPRTVQLPDGGYLSRGDLPPPTTKRWVASRKATVVKAVPCGCKQISVRSCAPLG
ncbi:MAG TPA: hypothetical protein DCX42_02650 [Planktomarina temperata]|nr:hypothetical protein [Planktomarina temperata]